MDFTNTNSPVAQDSSIQITLAVAMFMENWAVEMVDIKAAFLEAKLDKDIYIEWPEGVEELGYFSGRNRGQVAQTGEGNVQMRTVTPYDLQDVQQTS